LGQFNNNPRRPTKKAKLLNIIEKSLIAVAMVGITTLEDVIGFPSLFRISGIAIMNTPEYDPASGLKLGQQVPSACFSERGRFFISIFALDSKQRERICVHRGTLQE
jgi:altronate dehydratase